MAKRVAIKDKPKHYKRKTNDQHIQAIVDILKRNPSVLKDTGVRRAFREVERTLNKTERAFMSYKRANLF